jgi:hypothetical protein
MNVEAYRENKLKFIKQIIISLYCISLSCWDLLLGFSDKELEIDRLLTDTIKLNGTSKQLTGV